MAKEMQERKWAHCSWLRKIGLLWGLAGCQVKQGWEWHGEAFSDKFEQTASPIPYHAYRIRQEIAIIMSGNSHIIVYFFHK